MSNLTKILPTHYTEKEGGPWLLWTHGPIEPLILQGVPASSFVKLGSAPEFYSLRFNSGKEWDRTGGWRPNAFSGRTFPGPPADIDQYLIKSSPGVHGLEIAPDGIDPHAPGAKLDKGKVQAGILGQFSRALMAVAEVCTHGAEKYSRGGWQSVDNGIERYNDAGWRHKLKGEVEVLDQDSQLKHKAHEAWNILAELELILRKEESSND